jgi:hypothetical protein
MDRPYGSLAQRRSASTLLLAAFLLLIVTVPAVRAAAPCAIDQMPAATLLLPYFEVDPANSLGLTTLFSINNASAAAVLANVVVWTDLGVPTLGFQVYLTGYDIQTINLRDVFRGNLPGTATYGQDPQDTISPRGDYSQDFNIPSCTGFLPYQPLPDTFVAHLQAAHSGRFSSLFDGCAGQYLGDARLRGYVTVDTVNACTQMIPSDPGYFGPGGVATNQNVLWGDYIYVDPANKYSDGENLVRIKAFPGAFEPGDPTFYGRYVGSSGADARQPLATTWATRFVDGGTFAGGTDLVVWRDSGRIVRPFPCIAPPPGFPLGLHRGTIFDEEEASTDFVVGSPAPPPIRVPADAFPAEANRVHVGGPTLPTPFSFGWFHLDLNAPNPLNPEILRGDIHQSWVETILKAQGKFSAGFSATPLDSACAPAPQPFPF